MTIATAEPRFNTTGDRLKRNAGAYLLIFLAVYFSLQIVLRILYASSLGLDEAELLVITQTLQPGYGSQPPLYNWLQILAFEILGPGVPALAIVKNLLLFATFVFMFLSAKLIFEDEPKAALATLALFTIPQLAWESQRALAHTVIAVTLAAATLYVMLLLLRSGRLWLYVALGACFALGTMSKYNYPLFAVALVVAAASIPALRPRLLTPRFLLTLLTAAVLLVPHLVWVWTHMDATLSRVGKFRIGDDLSLVEAWGRGLLAALEGMVNYAALPVILFALIALVPLGRTGGAGGSGRTSPISRSSVGSSPTRLLILRSVVVAIILLLLLVLLTRTTEVKDRWLQPILFILPLGLFILFEQRLTGLRARALAAISVGLSLAAMVALTITHLYPDISRRSARATVPYAELARQIRTLGFEEGLILASNNHVAGNLKLRFPGSTVAEPEYGLWQVGGDRPSSLLVAWDSRKAPPKGLQGLLKELCGPDVATDISATPISARYEHSAKADYALSVAVLPMCAAPAGQ